MKDDAIVIASFDLAREMAKVPVHKSFDKFWEHDPNTILFLWVQWLFLGELSVVASLGTFFLLSISVKTPI